MEKILILSVGAILGVNARYWLSEWISQKFNGPFPFSTLLINLSGSFLIGFFLALAAERFILDPRYRLLVVVGFLGTYTTFSTYVFESFHLFNNGQWLAGSLNLLGSTLLGVIAVGAGILLAKAI